MKTKMNENESSYITAGFDVLNSYSTTVTNMAIQIGKRKVISSSSISSNSNSESSSNNNSSSSYQGVVNVSTDDEEDINENALTIKEIIFGSPFLNINLALSRAVILLMKKQPLAGMDISVLKLSLSGIVNQLKTDQFNAIKPYLPEKFDQSHVDHIADKIKRYEMKDDTSTMYEFILDLMESENLPIELVLLQIDTFNAKFLKTEGRTLESYTMLKKQDDSETTIYRRIATIFDFMHVKLADGETSCDRSKHERQYNDIAFGALSTDRELCGRKINLLVWYGRDAKDLELSSLT
ncbi:uncharacterized protein BX663DRAFT_547356 [Cokeromyces recurvatus]|uniref:uncharacterized protein n=1 Tax=Cokeromyces recurvatus TaxID=90255 RepID=UPI00221E3AE9|nr:uncharacterized protein BX663DRAFT_547356 [Cokeromyces recurvatus]KAI7907665.1 hypothetical protein BX663DRAFT_547356 [Cokeromyces recurvatus]